jgi:cell division protein FtsL
MKKEPFWTLFRLETEGLGLFAGAAVFVVALASIGVYEVWSRHQIFELGRELSEETSRHTELVDMQRKLKLEYSALKRAAQVERRASEELEMSIPEDRDYIVVKP